MESESGCQLTRGALKPLLCLATEACGPTAAAAAAASFESASAW